MKKIFISTTMLLSLTLLTACLNKNQTASLPPIDKNISEGLSTETSYQGTDDQIEPTQPTNIEQPIVTQPITSSGDKFTIKIAPTICLPADNGCLIHVSSSEKLNLEGFKVNIKVGSINKSWGLGNMEYDYEIPYGNVPKDNYFKFFIPANTFPAGKGTLSLLIDSLSKKAETSIEFIYVN